MQLHSRGGGGGGEGYESSIASIKRTLSTAATLSNRSLGQSRRARSSPQCTGSVACRTRQAWTAPTGAGSSLWHARGGWHPRSVHLFWSHPRSLRLRLGRATVGAHGQQLFGTELHLAPRLRLRTRCTHVRTHARTHARTHVVPHVVHHARVHRPPNDMPNPGVSNKDMSDTVKVDRCQPLQVSRVKHHTHKNANTDLHLRRQIKVFGCCG